MASTATQRTPEFERHGLTDEQLVAMLRVMILHRTLENRGFALNRQGKIPFASASEGDSHESVVCGDHHRLADLFQNQNGDGPNTSPPSVQRARPVGRHAAPGWSAPAVGVEVPPRLRCSA